MLPRRGTVDGAARHREPEAPFNEQPASSAPSDLGDAAAVAFGSATTARLAVSPKLGDTISDQRVSKSGMLVHGFLLWQSASHKSSCHKNSCQAASANTWIAGALVNTST